jgi:hypothetical protein
MPLIKPEIQKVLRHVGLSDRPEPSSENCSFSEKLDQAGLSNDEIAEELVQLAKNSGNEVLRLRALETALRVKGALRESAQTQAPPTFHITINSSPAAVSAPVPQNNIFLPRTSLAKLTGTDSDKVTEQTN